MYLKFQIDISITEGLVRIYTERRTDMVVMMIIYCIYTYILGFSTFPFGYHILRCKLNILYPVKGKKDCSNQKSKTNAQYDFRIYIFRKL